MNLLEQFVEAVNYQSDWLEMAYVILKSENCSFCLFFPKD